MVLYPKICFEKVTDIDIDFLNKNKLKALILDVDNTLLDINKNIIEGLEEWVEKMKKNDIKLFILSNSNKTNKVKKIAELINVPFFNLGLKPLKIKFKKIKKILNINNENIGVVGDQIFTDIFGANRCKMYSILVMPLYEKDILITKFMRPLENCVFKRYKNKSKEN